MYDFTIEKLMQIDIDSNREFLVSDIGDESGYEFVKSIIEKDVLNLIDDNGKDCVFKFIKALVERQEDIDFDERVFLYFAKKVIELKKGFIDGSLNPNGDDDLLDETYDVVNQLSNVFQKSNK